MTKIRYGSGNRHMEECTIALLQIEDVQQRFHLFRKLHFSRVDRCLQRLKNMVCCSVICMCIQIGCCYPMNHSDAELLGGLSLNESGFLFTLWYVHDMCSLGYINSLEFRAVISLHRVGRIHGQSHCAV